MSVARGSGEDSGVSGPLMPVECHQPYRQGCGGSSYPASLLPARSGSPEGQRPFGQAREGAQRWSYSP